MRRSIRSLLRLLVAALACVIVGALLPPAAAVAVTRDAPLLARPGLTGPMSQDQAAPWQLDAGSVTRRTSPGGPTVVLAAATLEPGTVEPGTVEPGTVERGSPGFRAKVHWWG